MLKETTEAFDGARTHNYKYYDKSIKFLFCSVVILSSERWCKKSSVAVLLHRTFIWFTKVSGLERIGEQNTRPAKKYPNYHDVSCTLQICSCRFPWFNIHTYKMQRRLFVCLSIADMNAFVGWSGLARNEDNIVFLLQYVWQRKQIDALIESYICKCLLYNVSTQFYIFLFFLQRHLRFKQTIIV